MKGIPDDIPEGVKVLVLDSNRIPSDQISLDKSIQDGIVVLSLKNNRLYSLEVSVAFPALRYLSLDQNDLDYLPNGTFLWARNLRGLSMSNNNLETIHGDVFQDIPSLEILNLSHNRLCKVDRNWFRGMRLLQRLNLSGNKIETLENGAFRHLQSLSELQLDGNGLKRMEPLALDGLMNMESFSLRNNAVSVIPRVAFQRVHAINELNLGNNPVKRLGYRSIGNLSVSRLTLSGMRELSVVCRQAFFNLSSLVELDLSNNRHLQYIDRDAFENVPALQVLDLQNSNLSAVEERISRSLPSLRSLRIHGNPVHCDCSARWIAARLASGSRAPFQDDERVTCSGPDEWYGLNIVNLAGNLSHQSGCQPRILPMFRHYYTLYPGENISLDCRAVGIPIPRVTWHLPASASGHSDPGERPSNDRANEDLVISFVEEADAGIYACNASNEHGYAESRVSIRLQTSSSRLVVTRVDSNAVTVTWRGIDSARSYRVVYRVNRSNRTHDVTEIRRYMKSYTVNYLSPDTQYEFCIAVVDGGRKYILNCTPVITKSTSPENVGIVSIRKYVIGIIVCATSLVILVFVALYARRYARYKRERRQLRQDHSSQLFLTSGDRAPEVTSVTFENPLAGMTDEDEVADAEGNVSPTEDESS